MLQRRALGGVLLILLLPPLANAAELVALAAANASKAGVSDRVTFLEGDIFEADLSLASVVTAYLFPEANLQLRPKLLAELPPGTRLVSNAFHMGDWTPDRREYGRTSGGAMLWIIPAQVGGDWMLALDGRLLSLRIEQYYQELNITLQEADESIPVISANLEGNQMTGKATIHSAGRTTVTRWQATQSRSVTGNSRIP